MVSLSSPLFFSFSGSFSLPLPSTYQFCSQTPLSQCFSLHAQLNADLPRYSHIGAVIKVRRYAVHLDMLKAWKSCNELTFSNMFIPVFKRSDPRNPLYHCHTHRIRILHKSQSKEHTFRHGIFVYSRGVDYPPTLLPSRDFTNTWQISPLESWREVFLNQGNLPQTYLL